MRSHRKWRLPKPLIVLAGITLSFLVLGQKTGAVNFVLPDYDFFSAGPNIHLEIAQTGDGSQITLDAPETWVKLFFDPNVGGNQIGVQMAAAEFICNPADSDSYFQIDSQGLNEICSDPNAVEYNFYCADGSGKNPNFGSQFYSINGNDPKFAAQGYRQVFDGPSYQIASPCPVTGVGPEGRYIVYMQARWTSTSPPEGRINGFKVGGYAAGSLASYWASGTGYAVQNRIDKMPGEDEFLNFEFAPQCVEAPTQLASLIWKDADATGNGGAPGDGGKFAGDNEISFDLFEGNQGGGGWVKMATVDSSGTTAYVPLAITPANIGGNGDTRQLQFTARNDKIYSWKWYSVNHDNGVQMTLPFDSYYYTKNCPPPGGGTPPAPIVSTVCQPNGTTNFTVSWNPIDTPAGTTRYFADVNDANSFAAAGGYWNKGPIALGTNSATGPVGFNDWPAGGPAMPALEPGVDYYARVYYDGPSGTASAVSASFTDVCPPPIISCTNINPMDFEAGDTNIDFKASIINQPGRAALRNSTATITIDGLDSPPYAVNPALSPGTPYLVRWNPYTAPTTPGEYPVTIRFSGGNSPAGSITCPGAISSSNKPYVRIFGGDIIAGSNSSCTAWKPTLPGSSGGILAFNNGFGKGSGTQLAAQALSSIIGFSSAQGRNVSPTPDIGLTRANTGGGFGGDFRIGSCPPDYFVNRGSALATVPPSYNPGIASGTYYSAGTQIIAGGTIGSGKKIVAYVEGNVYITGNINLGGGPWASADDIPSFVLITKGDIVIAPGVTNLEGVYVAQPTSASAGGTIRTCDTQAGLTLLQRATTECNARLTVIGAVTARRINLQRVSGTVKQAANNDCPIALAVYAGCGAPSTAAEQFIYSPEIWVRSNGVLGLPSAAKFDSITSLSPIF